MAGADEKKESEPPAAAGKGDTGAGDGKGKDGGGGGDGKGGGAKDDKGKGGEAEVASVAVPKGIEEVRMWNEHTRERLMRYGCMHSRVDGRDRHGP